MQGEPGTSQYIHRDYLLIAEKVHVEEAGMTAYLFKLNSEKTRYCTNVTWVVIHSYLESLGYPTLRAIPEIYGRSALYMVVIQGVGRLPRKSIISRSAFIYLKIMSPLYHFITCQIVWDNFQSFLNLYNHSGLGSYRNCTNLQPISRWVRAWNYWFPLLRTTDSFKTNCDTVFRCLSLCVTLSLSPSLARAKINCTDRSVKSMKTYRGILNTKP